LPEIPDWYAQTAKDGEDYAVLDLPINDRSFDKTYMQYQTTHEKPLVTGHVSRLPGEAFAFLDNLPLLQELRQRDQLPDPALTAVTQQLSLLHENNIRYIVIHKAFANAGLQNIWRDWLTFSPAYEDEELIVYRTRPSFGQDFELAHVLTPELGLINAKLSPNEAVQSGTVTVDARWGTTATPRDGYDLCLLLLTPSAEIVQAHCLAPDPMTPSDEWPAHDVRRGSYYLPISQEIESGSYQLGISLSEPGTSSDLVGEVAIIGDLVVHPFAPSHTVKASWQDSIHLVGYDLEQEEENLTATLFWQAQKPIDSSYKVFLHVVDKETGAIVAQNDAIPREWGYPTTAWKTGEIVRDVISLPQSGLSSDNYELHVGLYDELTGQRLMVVSNNSDTPQEYLTLNLKGP
jgi:hypothetical protein